jgi:hypothetical protein
MSKDWRCPHHGAIAPLYATKALSQEHIQQLAGRAGVPVWFPWPLPTGWVLTGAALAGDGRSPSLAAAMICSGPGPRGGPAELIFVSEEPGVGMGAGYAGLPGPDAGTLVLDRPPSARVMVDHHEVPLWEIPGPTDRSVYVGEAAGCWLWAVAWPMEVGLVLHDDLKLVDLRNPGHLLDLPLGAISPRWRPTGAPPGSRT